jgi:hypothetical protein
MAPTEAISPRKGSARGVNLPGSVRRAQHGAKKCTSNALWARFSGEIHKGVPAILTGSALRTNASASHIHAPMRVPVGLRGKGRLWLLSRCRISACGQRQYDKNHREPSMQVHCAEIGSIRLGSLFLTLPTQALTDQQVRRSRSSPPLQSLVRPARRPRSTGGSIVSASATDYRQAPEFPDTQLRIGVGAVRAGPSHDHLVA